MDKTAFLIMASYFYIDVNCVINVITNFIEISLWIAFDQNTNSFWELYVFKFKIFKSGD